MSVDDYRADILWKIRALTRTPDESFAQALVSDDATWDISSPVGSFTGGPEVVAGFHAPLKAALARLHRRDILVIGGQNRLAEHGTWVAAVCHYVGTFRAPLWGIRPSGKLVFLRAGEFYRIEGNRIVQARIILDLPDLLRQTGCLPIPHMLGPEIAFPAPATLDGVLPAPGKGGAAFDIVQRMIDALHVYDPKTMNSPDQTGEDGVWAEDMMWYGPCMIGSNTGWDGFVRDHRRPFLSAFPDRKGGNHYCRFGDADYAAMSGWPSMTMTHRGPYLGIEATDKPLTLRVMDFYRCTGVGTKHGKIAENWVFLDLVDLLQQLGRDLITEAAALP